MPCQPILEPKTIKDALSSEYAKKWKAAADAEFQSLLENDVWELVELPPHKNVVGSKWVFKVKYKGDSRVELQGMNGGKGLYAETRHWCMLKQAVIAVYVDDLLVLAKTEGDMKSVKSCLASHFKMKDLGELHYCLGVSVEWGEDHSYLWLHQKRFVLNLIKKHGLQDAKVASTPVDINVKLEKDDGISKAVDPATNQSIVGGLMYAATATCPDISFAVGVLSKFCSKPNMMHLTAVKHAAFDHVIFTVSCFC